ncbi:Secondary metabolism regulator LAE1 [Colletotrichum sp. SAR11_59]|nr:Secondary metabolism regulator LAE1 [Colletotrichum sp. SAR11_59]
MKLIFVATTFMLHGIASAKIAQMLCNNKPPLSQWGRTSLRIVLKTITGRATHAARRSSSYTASLTSSVIDYPIENGRRYHAYRAGSYFMPNDQNEMDRLDYAHLVTTKILGDKLGELSPVSFDISPFVHGIDLSAIQPEWAPPNVKFEIDDVESPWVDRTYDFINCHWMMGSIQDWPKLISNCYKNLNPGGWAEFLEMGGEYSSDDGSFTHDHATYKWIKTLFDGIASTGRDSRPGTKLKGWVENAGFENITYKKVKVPLGVWPKDPYYKEMGFLNLTNLLDGLEAFTLRIFCGVLGFTKEKTMLQLAEVRKELKDKRSFNAYYKV